MSDDVLQRFSAPVREWFTTTFAGATEAQRQGWPAIADGDHTLILAPTGSGKTLTAFLWAIDRLATTPPPTQPHRRLRVVYVSPLRALAVDVDCNLRAPIEGISVAGERLGVPVYRPDVGVRTGDTPQRERQRMRRTPPDVLITTPESLYLLLTSQARETLRGVEAVIIDEIHALAPTKRGSHLALTLERLEHEVRTGGLDPDQPPRPAPQRIALSATQRPLSEIARFLGGYDDPPLGTARSVTIVDAGMRKELDLEVVVPVPDMSELGQQADAGRNVEAMSGAAAQAPSRRSIWPAIHPRLLDLILEHRSTLIFVNARRLAERLAAKLNELHAQRHEEAELRERELDDDHLAQALQALADHGPGAGHAVADGLDPGSAADAVHAHLPELVRAHHGSLSRERRLTIEDELKSGRLRALVATSSLELGIDMGAVDQVVQVASPGAVSRGLQRIGRAGHQVDQPSRGVLMPKYRGDLVETAVVARRMHDGAIEATRYPRNPLDVLAQQIVAMVATAECEVDELARVIRRAAPFHDLNDEVLHAVLDLLSGRYPSEEFAELRPRIVWDRVARTVRARTGAQRLAVTNPGTIPDRGLFGVFLPDGTRVGELDEEMVHESRAGETFVLGASTWRIEDITHDRVVVSPAPGEPGKLPFWHGDGPGRPYELGQALGAFHRDILGQADDDRDAARTRLQAEHDLDAWAADNLVSYLEQQREITGAVPDDRTIVVERFRDELGDWRICLLSPFGAQVHAPWAMAIERRLTTEGYDPEVMWTDDGIVLRLVDATADPFTGAIGGVLGDPEPESAGDADGTGNGAPAAAPASVLDAMMIDPDEIEQLVVDQLGGTALFTTLFREAAGRALLLPKRMPGKRTALWHQRQRAADLLQVASRYPSFPLLLEATREALQDVFDLPSLRELLTQLRARTIRLTEVETSSASPFAQSLLFGWVGQYLYEYDAPLAERRAAALALDRDLLRELLGGDELRDLLDADVLHQLERELQRLAPDQPVAADDGAGDPDAVAPEVSHRDRRARDADELHDVLRQLGALSHDELADRARVDPTAWIEQLLAERRAIAVRLTGTERIAAAEDAARLRDAAGVALPPGLPQVHIDPVTEPLTDLVARYARSHGPFHAEACAHRLGVPVERVVTALRELEERDRVLAGEFRPHGSGREWVDTEVLRRLKRRSLAALREEVEPVDASALGRFLPAWQQVRAATGASRRHGVDALLETVGQLQGAPIPASVLEADVLSARLHGFRPSDLDELIVAGELVWVGVEPLGATDGRIALCFRDQVDRLAPTPVGDPPIGHLHAAIRDHLAGRGASFWPELFQAVGVSDQDSVLAALWDLVWAGEVTNDAFAPVRALVRSGVAGSRSGSHGGGRRGGRGRPGRLTRTGPPTAQGRWSLTRDLVGGEPPATTERVTAVAEQLLERHGVLTRESLRIESVPGGFATIYPVLRAAEEAGRLRRGYAVAGLGAAQFAVPGAIDRLRALREPPDRDQPTVVVLAATDPAQPYGAALPWPPTSGRPGRSAGAFVVLVDGAPAAQLERGARTLATFVHTADPGMWLPALTALVDAGRLRKLEITTIDGADVHDDPDWPGHLAAAGFSSGYRGWTYRAPAAGG